MLKKMEKVEKEKAPDVSFVDVDTKKPSNEDKRLADIASQRNALIKEVRSKIMPNSALRRGGPGNRSKYSQEVTAWAPVIGQINELGRQLHIRDIGLGELRG